LCVCVFVFVFADFIFFCQPNFNISHYISCFFIQNIENVEAEDEKEEALNRLNTELKSFISPIAQPAERSAYDQWYLQLLPLSIL